MKEKIGKARYDLITKEMLDSFAEILEFGAEKYAPWDWMDGIDFLDLYAAAMRHLLKWHTGEDLDPESGLPHLSHALTNIGMLCTYQRLGPRYMDKDNRPILSEGLRKCRHDSGA